MKNKEIVMYTLAYAIGLSVGMYFNKEPWIINFLIFPITLLICRKIDDMMKND